jgi:hypothetical protein
LPTRVAQGWALLGSKAPGYELTHPSFARFPFLCQRFYLIGSTATDDHYRVLKIDRTEANWDLAITEDDFVYTKAEIVDLLKTLESVNKSTGGLKKVVPACGVIGTETLGLLARGVFSHRPPCYRPTEPHTSFLYNTK